MTKRGQAMQKRKHPLDRDEYFHYNIMLGSACNWRCPYCIQSEEPIKQSDPYKFCNQFVRYLTRTKQIDKVYSFSFWGGEPLLYHNTLEILIKELSKIPMKRPIRVTSNGSLLTKNNYTVFNKYGINFEISYHEGQLTDDKWEIALRIENLSVSSLITHKILDWDFYKSEWYKIYQKFGRFVKWGIFPVITAGKNVNDYALTKEDIDELINLAKKLKSEFKILGELIKVFLCITPYLTNSTFFNAGTIEKIRFCSPNLRLVWKPTPTPTKKTCFKSSKLPELIGYLWVFRL